MKDKLHYSCKNCHKLKERSVKKSDLNKIDKNTLKVAVKTHTTESLNISFPINVPLYNRIKKYGQCRIIYCSADMLKRALYIYRENLDIDGITPDRTRPCPSYR
ncbi:MAG: hypothetical protein ABIA97_01075 [Candidatus Omnitrophota bacterium]